MEKKTRCSNVFLLGNGKISASFHLLNPNSMTDTKQIKYTLLFKTTYGFQHFFQGTLRIYLIIYQVLGNSLHCQETDDLHNFQYHRLEFLHIHCHYHSHLGLFHIYALLCSNSKNSDILKLIIVTCNRGDTILCTRWAPANKRKLISSTSRKFSMSCQVS